MCFASGSFIKPFDCVSSSFSTLRSSDVRFSLCIIGIQALAELNQWEQVLSWVLEIYEIPEKIPAKILQIW